MELKRFGTTRRDVSEIGMGTYYDPAWIATAYLGWRRGAKAKVEALKVGLGMGITLIDTAEIYGSEQLVAKAIEGRKREELFIATKVWSNHLRRDQVRRSLEKSLKRLSTSYVDLYQVHFPSGRVPIAETMAAMEGLVRDGKVVSVGVSNFNFVQLQEAVAALPNSRLASIQMNYNMMNRAIERDILPYCDKEDIAVMAYYPLAHGKLTSSNPKIAALCAKHSKTPSQIALRWLAQMKNVFPIPRASNPAHVAENAGASGWKLSEQDTAQLNQAFS